MGERTLKKVWLCFLSLILAVSLVGCGGNDQETAQNETQGPGQGSGNADSEKIVLKLGHTQGGEHPYQKGAEKFKELVEAKSNGRLQIDLFPNSQLGNQREMVEGLQLGTLELHIGTLTAVASFAPKYNVVILPYLFRDSEHAHKVLNGEVGKELEADLEAQGISILGYWDNGWRHMTNDVRPIKTAEDVKGLKIRVQDSPIYISFIKALGATPTPIPFAELYTALETNVVDGQEQPLAQMATNRFYEVQKYLTLTGHTFEPGALYVSKQAYEKLPSDLQNILKEAAVEAGEYERKLVKDEEAKFLQQLKDGGMIVEENPDIESFRKAVEPVYKEFEQQLGKDLIDKIRNTQ